MLVDTHNVVRLSLLPSAILFPLICPVAEYHQQHRRPATPESQEQYTARLRRAREEQEQAAERRAREEANRKANLERERERGTSYTPMTPFSHHSD